MSTKARNEQQLLAKYTTLGLGGPARRFSTARTSDELADLVRTADAAGDDVLLLGGGSNLVIADAGFSGHVIHIATCGVDAGRDGRLTVAAGEAWDDVVANAVERGWSGIEALSGIPGAAGATPIQNVGAYGASVSDTITRVRVLDRASGDVVDLDHAECEFGYRQSRFKRTGQFVVLEVEYQLDTNGESAPIRYAELARQLGVALGERAELQAVRDAVVELRRAKGMVLDSLDPDSRSAGSFFTNPILSTEEFARLTRRVRAVLGDDAAPPAWPDESGATKVSAAWLIERAGFRKGYGDGPVGISSKHTLAIVNRGGGSTRDLLDVARRVRDGVRDTFGVELHPEPVLVGCTL